MMFFLKWICVVLFATLAVAAGVTAEELEAKGKDGSNVYLFFGICLAMLAAAIAANWDIA